ncbi:MAG: class I SAM-dependent methyltransferase [Caldilineaceae bacterium]|nr:class I SAM-dependent methyltransferase [Caldilineaceae bacterium]
MPDLNVIAPQEGRALFGANVQSYDAIRPPYPEQLYALLCSTGALRANSTTLEIGAGNGLATRRLLEFGANPLTALEPDPRFAPLLQSIAAAMQADFDLIHAAFEEAVLPTNYYDLVASATAFHWIDRATGLTKVATVLKPGGHAALWWNVFGDPDRADPFHEATQQILQPLATSPSDTPQRTPFALDLPARLGDFAATGQFEEPVYQFYPWPLVLNTAQVGALYGTFSGINRLPAAERQYILDQLMTVAAEKFSGRVERNMVSAIYVARRK